MFGNSWDEVLKDGISSTEFQSLLDRVNREYEKEKVYPAKKNIFRALEELDFKDVKVVILGQDPYFNEGEANGFAFSVDNGVKKPPSLQNIIKEVREDLGIDDFEATADLNQWAKQGVLLLNSILTVRAKEAGSHRNIGWEDFTDTIIEKLSEKEEPVVFILWGNFAKNKAKLIDENKNLIIRGVHPSPLSAYRGFFGKQYFSRANKFLISKGIEPIKWVL